MVHNMTKLNRPFSFVLCCFASSSNSAFHSTVSFAFISFRRMKAVHNIDGTTHVSDVTK